MTIYKMSKTKFSFACQHFILQCLEPEILSLTRGAQDSCNQMQSLKQKYTISQSVHFSTRVREHLVNDRASHIFKHLENSEHCHALCSVDCFHILDHASTTFQLKIKEAFHIRREQPSLNQQLHHVNLKLSF